MGWGDGIRSTGPKKPKRSVDFARRGLLELLIVTVGGLGLIARRWGATNLARTTPTKENHSWH